MPLGGINPMLNVDLNTGRADTLSRVNPETAEDERLLEVSREFESIFVNMMLKSMRGTIVEDDSLIPKSQGTKMFEEMYDQELSKEMTMGGSGIGLAETIYKQMKASKAYSQHKL